MCNGQQAECSTAHDINAAATYTVYALWWALEPTDYIRLPISLWPSLYTVPAPVIRLGVHALLQLTVCK